MTNKLIRLNRNYGSFVDNEPLSKKIETLEYQRKFAESLNVLYSFLNPLYTKKVSLEEATKHLKDSLVSVHANKDGSNGVLCGNYVVCTYHGLEKIIKPRKELGDLEKLEVIKHTNKLYEFRFVDFDRNNDLALLYINSNGSFCPLKITGISNELEVGRNVIVLAIRPNRRIDKRVGKITHVGVDAEDPITKRIYYNTFITDAYCTAGFSGGIVADLNTSSFLGLIHHRPLDKKYAMGIGIDVITPFLLKASAKEIKRVSKL
ncbi:trypsin-like peptidase domain-containing protein [Candidatus Woesearchaeota archaeon]|nr:trypsin-like peptidase domain-containing protein [Candidatus Woesearchaeota archaeon]